MGNRYTYVGFFTEEERNNFCGNDDTLRKKLGNFRELKWLDAFNRKWARNIPKDLDEEKIREKITNTIGDIINSRKKREDRNGIFNKYHMLRRGTNENMGRDRR